MLPKMYVVAHPRCPYRVVFAGPDGKRVARHFKVKAEALTYHRELLAKAKVAGTVGLVMDAEMRADYFAARAALGGVPVLSAVRYFLSHCPVGKAAEALPAVRELFLADKRRVGRAERTVESLKSAIDAFLGGSSAKVAADFTREGLTGYLDSLSVPPLTLRTHRARLSAFGEWMARRGYLPENPVRYIEVSSYDPRPPRVLTPVEAEAVIARARSYRDGRFLGAYCLALYAGLRYGEIQRLTWEDIVLDGAAPMIRVGRGKIRGRRAVRVVPIGAPLVAWLKLVRCKKLPLVGEGDSRKVREVIYWQGDIMRHSWISYRLALDGNEVKVAREAGNSPDIIYRHYFQLVSLSDALRFFSCWP